MLLSETKSAEKWFMQFAPLDRQYAELLINGLTFVSKAALEKELYDVVSLVARFAEAPFTILAVSEVVDKGGPWDHYITEEPDYTCELWNFLRRHIFQNVGPFIEDMRELKCRSVFFVADAIGTGERIIRFIEGFEKNQTIRSWRSYGLLKYYVIALAGTETAAMRIRKEKKNLEVHFLRRTPIIGSIVDCADLGMPWGYFEQSWTDNQRKALVDLCKRYGPQSFNRKYGYRHCRSSLVFESGAPDDVPALLWASSRHWHPLFPDREVPKELAVALKSRRYNVPKKEDRAIALLALLENPHNIENGFLIRDPEYLADRLAASKHEVERLLKRCRRNKHLDGMHRLTRDGMEFLAKFRNERIMEENDTKEPYFPKSMRRARS